MQSNTSISNLNKRVFVLGNNHNHVKVQMREYYRVPRTSFMSRVNDTYTYVENENVFRGLRDAELWVLEGTTGTNFAKLVVQLAVAQKLRVRVMPEMYLGEVVKNVPFTTQFTDFLKEKIVQ